MSARGTLSNVMLPSWARRDGSVRCYPVWILRQEQAHQSRELIFPSFFKQALCSMFSHTIPPK